MLSHWCCQLYCICGQKWCWKHHIGWHILSTCKCCTLHTLTHTQSNQFLMAIWCLFSLQFIDKTDDCLGHTVMLLHKRYAERWFRLSMVGKEFTKFNNTVASFLRTHTDHCVSDDWRCGKGSKHITGTTATAIGNKQRESIVGGAQQWIAPNEWGSSGWTHHRSPNDYRKYVAKYGGSGQFDVIVAIVAFGCCIAKCLYKTAGSQSASRIDTSKRKNGHNGRLNAYIAIHWCGCHATNFAFDVNDSNTLVAVIRFTAARCRIQSIFTSCDWLQRTDIGFIALRNWWNLLFSIARWVAWNSFVYWKRWLPYYSVITKVSELLKIVYKKNVTNNMHFQLDVSCCRFQILEKGPKLLYLNTCIRGYPKGLRAGPDPRKPLISVDEHFEKIEYRAVPSVLFAIEVSFGDNIAQ